MLCYVAYALSLRNLEEMMQERGLFVDHSTIHPLADSRAGGKPSANGSANADVHQDPRQGRTWYRAVDEEGNTVDFLLTAARDRRAARRFFTRAVKNNRTTAFPRSSTSTRAARTTPESPTTIVPM
jgi:putative transposase